MKLPKKWKPSEKPVMKSKKIILDTNLWISFLITQKYTEIDNLIIERKIRLIFSHELIEEYITVATRPKFKKFFDDTDIEKLLELFDSYGKLIKVNIEINKCRDPKDNFLLSLAVESKADYLITGDSDLLILKKIKKTKILSWNDFKNELR